MNNNYKCLDNAYKEYFFISYAVEGPIIVPGTRQGLPVLHPISGPVNEPSPLNSQYLYTQPNNTIGVL